MEKPVLQINPVCSTYRLHDSTKIQVDQSSTASGDCCIVQPSSKVRQKSYREKSATLLGGKNQPCAARGKYFILSVS